MPKKADNPKKIVKEKECLNLERDELIIYITKVKTFYDQDRKKDMNGMDLPGAFDKKYPNAGKEWGAGFFGQVLTKIRIADLCKNILKYILIIC